MKYTIIFVGLFLLLGCYADETKFDRHQEYSNTSASTSQSIELSLHTSRYHGIQFEYPRGWLVEGEGQRLSIVQEKSHFPWEYLDPDKDVMYVVSSISPYLSFEDYKAKKTRPVLDFARSTAHSLVVTEDAEIIGPAREMDLKGLAAAGFLLSIDTHLHYQIFLRLRPDKIVTVAAIGPADKRNEMRTILHTIARSIKAI